MRIAVAGKGGTGKTTIAGMLGRLFGRRGRSVLALDADSNPNLAISLGLSRDRAARIQAVPHTLGEWRTSNEGQAYVHLNLPLDEVTGKYGIAAPDNVTLLVMGTVDHAGIGCRCNAHAAARGIMGHLIQVDAPIVIADMEAGLEHLGRGTVEHADALLIVVEPYYRALETGRQVKALATSLGVPRVYTVANKIRTATDEAAVTAFCRQHDLSLIATLPFDEEAPDAEAKGLTLLDIHPEGPLVDAIAALVTTLEEKLNGISG
jgi:CO dehydrogenase maturation factor